MRGERRGRGGGGGGRGLKAFGGRGLKAFGEHGLKADTEAVLDVVVVAVLDVVVELDAAVVLLDSSSVEEEGTGGLGMEGTRSRSPSSCPSSSLSLRGVTGALRRTALRAETARLTS